MRRGRVSVTERLFLLDIKEGNGTNLLRLRQCVYGVEEFFVVGFGFLGIHAEDAADFLDHFSFGVALHEIVSVRRR
jgi:hypothetical protein